MEAAIQTSTRHQVVGGEVKESALARGEPGGRPTLSLQDHWVIWGQCLTVVMSLKQVGVVGREWHMVP